jgi:DNA phosphorothioation-associated putative methyltransferase
MPSARHRTALRREELSRPIRLAMTHELLLPHRTFFDYGCGRGDDLRRLQDAGIMAEGWDPAHRPDAERRPADVVNLGYVVNVIEDLSERAETLKQAWALSRSVLVVAARLSDERDEAHVAPLRDGWVTRHGTFQKFFEHDELRTWIRSTLGADPVAASLGIYYVFRKPHERESYLASRFRRPIALPRARPSDEQFHANRELLEPLITFVGQRGRLPDATELPNTDELVDVFGSLRKAFRIVLWVTDSEAWEHVRQERAVDLLIHLALASFHGRPRWSDLPDDLQRDVRAFFTSYKAACERADKLLFSTGRREAVDLAARIAAVGKVTPSAIYVHTSGLNELPALLRVYEGCARALVGTVEGVNVIKLSREEPRVSYLEYPRFEKDPHPSLERSVVCDLQALRVRTRNFSGHRNPPILHRKEEFVAPQHPLRSKFERLTKAEERAGLYVSPDRIGTRNGWQEVCNEAGVELRGHRVVSARASE